MGFYKEFSVSKKSQLAEGPAMVSSLSTSHWTWEPSLIHSLHPPATKEVTRCVLCLPNQRPWVQGTASRDQEPQSPSWLMVTEYRNIFKQQISGLHTHLLHLVIYWGLIGQAQNWAPRQCWGHKDETDCWFKVWETLTI